MTVINDNQNARVEADMYITNVALPKDGAVQKKVNELQDKVTKELHNLVVKCVNQECGVGLAKEVLSAVKSQVNVFLREMNSEKADLESIQPNLDNAVSVAATDLAEYCSKFFKRGSIVSQMEQAVFGAAMALAVNKREIIRRGAAISFFTSLLVEITDEEKKVNDIEKKLKAVNTSFVNQIAALTNSVDRQDGVTFQIDLAKQAINTIGINEDEIQINDFLKTLPHKEQFYKIDSLETEDVEKVFLKYTKGLPTAKKWANTTIDDVLKKMDQESSQKLDNVLRIALAKAQPLLGINTRGQVGYSYGSFCYVGVPMGSTILQNNDRLKNIAGGETIHFAKYGMQDRVIIFNQIGVVPAYFLSNIQNYEQKYEKCSIFSHIDALFFQQMQREKFSLYPKLDDGSEDVETWVKGFILRLIKNENGRYLVKDKTNGKALRQYWVEIGTYRDEAFNAFKSDIHNLRQQINEQLTKQEKDKGKEEMEKLLADVKENYLENYSQVNMTLDEIEARGNEQIAALMEKELNYVNDL